MYIKIILTVLVLGRVDAANILAIYPTPSISHQIVYRKVTLELIKQGHEVTVITTDPAYPRKDGPKNLTEIDLHDSSYKAMYEEIRKFSGKVIRQSTDLSFYLRFTNHLCDLQMQVPEVQEILFGKQKQYDLIILEEVARPYLAISHFSKAPIILFNSASALLPTREVFGLQTHPFLYPMHVGTRFYDLTLWEKIVNLHRYVSLLFNNRKLEEEEQIMLQKYFGPELPKMSELYKNVHLLLVNTHSIWVGNQPVPPSVVFLGGIHQSEPKELPKELKSYLDSSKHGVIYVSFGTNALSTILEMDKIEILAKVLGQMPYDVLWKWDLDTLPGQTKNIRLSKWLPQADLLKHPKIKLFITQAGLQSTDEAITAGVPLVAFPVFDINDQWYNAEKYENHGIGKKVVFDEITEDLAKNAIETVITDESYRKNIVKLRELIYDQPMQPLERALFWINHVIRNKGGKHLLPAGANLTWAQYYELELLLLLLSATLISFILLMSAVYYLFKNVKSISTGDKLKQT